MSAKALGVLALLFAFLATTVAASGGIAVSPPVQQRALSAVEAADSETVVDIPDAALRKAVEEALEKETDEPITRGEMESLQTLYAEGVQQLTGIEYAVNLHELWAIRGAVSDLVPLAGLTSLTELVLHSNEISDVAPLSNLTSLEFLWLSNNFVLDLAPLAGLTSLTELRLGENVVSDLEPLAGLTSLAVLYLFNTLVSDLTPLSNLTSLASLELGGTRISDLEPLAGLNLVILGLLGTSISDLTPLSAIPSLRYLDLRTSSISDLTELSGLTFLRELSLNNNWIEDLEPLSSLTSLRYLNLDRNYVRNVAPLAGLTSLTRLVLARNYIVDAEPLARNTGLGDGDRLNLKGNTLSAKSLETDIPRLLQRGVEVLFDDPVRDGAELFAAIADPALAEAVVEARSDYWNRSRSPYTVRGPYTVDDLAELRVLEASNCRIEDLGGLELATGLRRLDLRGNSVADLAPLAGLTSLFGLHLGGNDISDIGPLAGLNLVDLSLDDNVIEDFAPLADMTSLVSLALDGNSIRDLPTLPTSLNYLYLTNNSISDIAPLANLSGLIELQLSGNSITSLAPLAEIRLRYLFLNDNQVTDLTPLNIESLVELHLRNNAVEDLSPLLRGDRLAMVDVRGNPLSGDAVSILNSLREAGTTVLAGEAVPYFPAAGADREGFVRVINRSDADGEVFVEAVDDAGVHFGPVRLDVGARRAVHFTSADLQNGNAAKGFRAGIGQPTAGDWRLALISSLDIEVLSYVRTADGFVTAMHDVVPEAVLPTFNPGSNKEQQSILRVVNTEAEPAKWVTGGYDDRGLWHPMAGAIKVRPGNALTLTAEALENTHGLGDGHGKWRLRVRGFPWLAMSLLAGPTGHLTNLSTVPNNAEALADGARRHRAPLFPAARGMRQGFVRVINRSTLSGEVTIEAVDDEGNRSGPARLEMPPLQTVHFNSNDLEAGNAAKGLSGGVGIGEGDWRLELTSTLDLRVLSYVRTEDGFLTSMHDLAPLATDGSHRVVFFNPGSNTRQVSKLRLINNGDRAASATITGVDDDGVDSGTVSVTVPAASALTFAAAELEAGGGHLSGSLGDGAGKWRLRVSSNVPLAVMSLLESPTSHLANVSTGTAD